MIEKVLGKITSAEFGKVHDREFLCGLILTFKLADGCCIADGGTGTVNMSKECRWEESERTEALADLLDMVYKILNDAHVNTVSELVGKPVEVTIGGNCFKNFRILTEVI